MLPGFSSVMIMTDPIASHPGNVLPFARPRTAAERGGAAGMSGILRVGSHRVDLGALRVISDPERPRLTLKAAMVLVELARRGGQTLSRDDLLGTVWAGTTPTPEVVTQAIRELRRALGDNGDGPRQIETVPKLGYRLVVPVEFVAAVEPAAAGAANDATPAPIEPVDVASPPRRKSSRRAMLATLAVAATLAAAVVVYALLPRAAAREWRAQSLRVLTNLPGPEQYPHISNDGLRFAYSRFDGVDERVSVREIDASRAREIEGDGDAHDHYAVWSPNDAELAFIRKEKDRCRIVATPLAGGPVRELGVCGREVATLYSWTPDGGAIVSSGLDGPDGFGTRPVVQHPGRAPQEIAYPRAQTSYDLDPKYSPDGRRLAFRRGTIPFSDLYVMEAGDPDSVRRLTRLASTMFGYDWTRDGAALVFSSDHEGPPALYAVDVADARLTALGIAPATWPDLALHADVGVYEIPEHHIQMRRLDLARADKPAPLAASSANDVGARISPDGKRVALLSDRSGSWQVWIHDLSTGDAFAISNLARRMPEFPEWRPDGRAVGFITHGSGPGDAREIEIDSRVERRLGSAGLDARRVTYAADGAVLLVAVKNGAAALYRVEADRETELVAGASFAREAAGGDVLFNYADRDGLFRRSARDGAIVLLTPDVSNRLRRGWDIVGNRVYYVEPMREHAPVMRYDLSSGALDEVAATLCGVSAHSLSVFADERAAIASCSESYESDVGLLRIDRGG
jgi:DNA-binding winged helix-turn-helix (wHTH) protein/Tol biopolymer transport system component